ncbi:iron-containing alcohol dehydrogenase [Herpetosiphon geysericola]|uniref:Alcohol dehydrogenase n=1 Tax=Herpetosiphon geysericola TaxID=70996 RepID=A0A0P6YGG1_9CHLR|nr:iron-containing alcohol dehydrogenase [Herpetosiphon geysericola]KPL91299.1 alcohol dehydrogenase [Herpetosiphon geysericola]
MQEFFEFRLIPRVLYKAGLVAEMGAELSSLGATKGFIVTDAGLVKSGLVAQVQQALAETIEIVGVYSDVPPNSSVAVVEAAAAQAREAGADLLIALGGGSPIDTAKAMRIVITEGGNLLDYEGINVLERRLIPMVAIPTTAGTGSEASNFAVIKDEVNNVKLSFTSPYLAPELAILDPQVTQSLPPHLAAATGMDALTHCFETYVSTEAEPMSDALALGAIEIVSNYLRDATHHGSTNEEARGQMLIASCMAGIAFTNSYLGAVHALAHATGGHFPLHHGLLNSIFLPHVVAFNANTVPDRYARIARAFGINTGGRPREEVIDDLIAGLRQLASDCGLITQLRDLGIPEDALPMLAEQAFSDGAVYHNPLAPSVEDLLGILQAAW